METKQKIRNCIIILILMFILTSFCVFHAKLNTIIVNLFADKFSIVTNKNTLLVHFIDVGQGDAVAINFPDGKVMVIDCGSQNVNTDFVNYIKENVTNTKKNNYIDFLVLSHADEDHVGGAEKLLNSFDVGIIYMPMLSSETGVYQRLISFVEKNVNFEVCDDEFEIQGKDYCIKFFDILSSVDTNESSQIVKVSAFGTSFLFTGDISTETEMDYLEIYDEELDCDVLKIAHHGAKNSTSQKFIDAVSPDYAVISVGENNIYGHPNEETIERLNSANVEIVRTDECGDVLCAVGNIYGLKLFSENYNITGLSLDYSGFILICDVCLIFVCVQISLVPKKKKVLASGQKKK